MRAYHRPLIEVVAWVVVTDTPGQLTGGRLRQTSILLIDGRDFGRDESLVSSQSLRDAPGMLRTEKSVRA